MKTGIKSAGSGKNIGRFFGFYLFLILMVSPGAGRAFAYTLENLLGGELAAAMVSGEKPQEVQFKDPQFRLLPWHGRVRETIDAARESLDPEIMVETLSLYRKPASAGQAAWSEAERIGLYNSVLALSSLTGLQYYSASRKVMRTFYESSFVIDDPAAKTAAPDPVFHTPPALFTVFARQKDLTFGDNVYQYDYYSFPDALIFVQENLTSLNYGIITAIGKNRLRSAVAVIDAGEYLLVYAVSMAKAASLPGVKTRIGNSFSNRAEAVLRWFEGKADRVFAAR
jgi:hypothetical protein